MVGIVLVSHSEKIAEGVRDLSMQMASPETKILAAGGLPGGEIGTDFQRILEAIQGADSGDGVVVLVDLGSAIMSTEAALDFLDEDLRARVVLADAPIVEGAISCSVSASIGGSLEEVKAAAEESRGVKKF
jgi:dihydroxyacetone kinase phosphotransfer subunit